MRAGSVLGRAVRILPNINRQVPTKNHPVFSFVKNLGNATFSRSSPTR